MTNGEFNITDDLGALEKYIHKAIADNKTVSIRYTDSSVAVRYADAVKIIEILEPYRPVINIDIRGIPLCVFPKENHRWAVFSAIIGDYKGEFLDKCAGCGFSPFCHGVPQSYVKRFGSDDIIPPNMEELFMVDFNSFGSMEPLWNDSIFVTKDAWDLFFRSVPGKILDVGAGVGGFLSFDPERITGIDNSMPKVENVMKNKLNLNLIYGDALDMPFENECFSGIYSRFFLEHLDRDKVLVSFREMARVLKPEGKLLIETIGKDAVSGGLWEDNNSFSAGELAIFAKMAGFKKIREVPGANFTPFAGFNFNAEAGFVPKKEIAIGMIAEK